MVVTYRLLRCLVARLLPGFITFLWHLSCSSTPLRRTLTCFVNDSGICTRPDSLYKGRSDFHTLKALRGSFPRKIWGIQVRPGRRSSEAQGKHQKEQPGFRFHAVASCAAVGIEAAKGQGRTIVWESSGVLRKSEQKASRSRILHFFQVGSGVGVLAYVHVETRDTRQIGATEIEQNAQRVCVASRG
ncbi:hypothetical protein KCU89_g16, partial [Aureobasidium melanogenum]